MNNTNYDHTTDWFYEGNISHLFVNYLKQNNYEILKDNSENIKAKGIDIIAKNKKFIELIEVKGYPTEFYVNEKNKGNKKKTNPKLQAKHWISEALLSCIFNYGNEKSKYDKPIKLSIVLPNMPRYQELSSKLKNFILDFKIDLNIYFVSENGSIIKQNT